MEKNIITTGTDYTSTVPIFRDLVLKSGVKQGANLIWAGCPGTCYAMATFFSFGLRDLGLNLYFAVDADINNLWRLEYIKKLGMMATKKEEPLKAEIIILMSGLLRVPFEKILKLTRVALADEGTIIGETVVPGLFEKEKWNERIPLRFIFEFSMVSPTSFELTATSPGK